MEQIDIDLLQSLPAYHLQALAKLLHTSVSVGSTESAASSQQLQEIAQQLFDMPRIHEALQELDETERLVLRELVACGGRANSRDLALYFSSGNMITKKSGTADVHEPVSLPAETYRSYQPVTPTPSTLMPHYPTAHPHGVFELAVRHLLLLGLLFWGKQTSFSGRDYASGIHDGVLIVPKAVRQIVQDEWGVAGTKELFAPVALAGTEQGEDVAESIRLLQRTLYVYWSVVASAREGLSVLSNGLLARSSLRLIVEHMGQKTQGEQVRTESDVPRLLFLRLLLMKLGLLQERANSIVAASPTEFFALPVLERARRCYQLWLETPFWNELLYLPEVMVRPGPGPIEPPHEEVIRARQTIIERLRYEIRDGWHSLTTFIARTKLYTPYLLFPRQYGPRAERYSSGSNPYGWDFRLRRGWLTHREGWHMVEGGFIRAIVTGPLSWLGLVAVDAEENPTSFRFAQGADMVMSDTEVAYAEVPRGRLIVQPNFELLVLAPVSEALLVSLDRFAERVSLDMIAQYRLTKASVRRATQVGLRAETIQQELEHAVGGEIPQNVSYSLSEWERQARRVEMWQDATLLEVDDPAVLDALFADEKTRHLLQRRIAPLLAEVVPRHVSALQEALWQREYLPSITNAPTQDTISENGRFVVRETQWRLHQNGLLQPLYTVLDMYLATEATRFCERDEATGWQCITQASLQRAQHAGIALEYVLRFLQQYCEDGIPSSLLIRMKLWGNGYGEHHTIAIESAPLLRLSAAVLQDLQIDDALKPFLGSEVEEQSRLVRVQGEHLARVVELLKERGFEIE